MPDPVADRPRVTEEIADRPMARPDRVRVESIRPARPLAPPEAAAEGQRDPQAPVVTALRVAVAAGGPRELRAHDRRPRRGVQRPEAVEQGEARREPCERHGPPARPAVPATRGLLDDGGAKS